MLVLVTSLAAVACSGEPPPPTTTTHPPTRTSSPPTTTTPPPATEVPDVTGEDQASARSLLGELGLVSAIRKRYSREVEGGVVILVTPKPGQLVQVGSTVDLLVAKPFPRIPGVLSKNLSQAKRTLRGVGFDVDVLQRDSTTEPDGDVVLQRPPAGTEARPGRVVTLFVINNVCTPGYTPCIRRGPDVDCLPADGDNGPRYTSTTYRVTGPDIYDLDRDNDGFGCE